jgi:hypothetical protein
MKEPGNRTEAFHFHGKDSFTRLGIVPGVVFIPCLRIYWDSIDIIYTDCYTLKSKKGMNIVKKKTAVSIEEPLFEEMEDLAAEMEVSRSSLFALAAREFIQRHKSQKLLDSINAAYGDSPDVSEERLKSQMKSKHRQLVKGQW